MVVIDTQIIVVSLVGSGVGRDSRWRDGIPLQFSLLTLLVIATTCAVLFAVARLNEIVAVVIVAVGIAILMRLIAGGMDGRRIREYIRSQGGELLD